MERGQITGDDLLPPEQKPLSLDDLGFTQRSGTKLIRDDPKLPFIATIHADGRLTFRNRRSRKKFYVHKTRIQNETRELRLRLARRWVQRVMKERLRELGGQLARIWSQPEPARVRRAALFELWDECAEEVLVGKTPSSADAAVARERAKMGERARAKIIAFIAKLLPMGSADAYPPSELRELNARRISRQRFHPYDGVATSTQKSGEEPAR